MSWLYQRQRYWIPRQQTVRYSNGRKVETTRFGPREWTRTTTQRDGSKSLARSTADGPMTKVVGVLMLLIAPGAILGVYSIPIYLGAIFLFVLWALLANDRSSKTLHPPRPTASSKTATIASPQSGPPSHPPSEEGSDRKQVEGGTTVTREDSQRWKVAKQVLPTCKKDVRYPESGKDSPMGSIESAVRRSIAPGTVLSTPTGRGQFTIAEIGARGPVLLLGRKEARTLIPWAALEGVSGFLGADEWHAIGSVFDQAADRSTFDGYMKRFVNRATAGWVACLLEAAGVVHIDRRPPARVRMQPDFTGPTANEAHRLGQSSTPSPG
jgi:hypothetical protein